MTDDHRTADPARVSPRLAGASGWGWLMAYGIALFICAVLALLWPFPATLAATLVCGAMLIVLGVSALVAAVRHKGTRQLYDAVTGVLALVAGLLIALRPLSGAITLTVILAIWLAARGVVEIYFALRRMRGRGWMALMGVVNLLLAAMIAFTLPMSGLLVPGTLLAVTFLVSGAAAIAHAIDLRRQRPWDDAQPISA